ncbi:MAG: TIM44-like domain-containing protein [Candidatus Doudnabacteria bacterium]|nr:TIM44-like domain-containing protein [Candidatus Doudnabacteria bacterium]
MKSKIKTIFLIVLLNFFHIINYAQARGGGGGSGGGWGGGGGGGFSGGSFSSGSSGSSVSFSPWMLLFLIIPIVAAILVFKNKKRLLELAKMKGDEIIKKNNLDKGALYKKIEELFKNFQKAWGEFDLKAMERLVTPEYYKRMVLELTVLQNEQRANPMSEVTIDELFIVGEEQPGETTQKLTVEISASAHDVLMDTKNNKPLFTDDSNFTECWHLVQTLSNEWVLDFITQDTENLSLVENDIVEFAKNNNFYFDTDFGWLMMPNKGVLFKQTDFGRSDINNHVIGYFRNKIVEFYTYIPNTNSKSPNNYIIAQAILPKAYNNILIKKKHWLNFPVWGLKRQMLESVDFNNKFCLWAEPQDRVNSLELLTPNFMERIYNLPFELNIELVGNVLYFYTKDRGAANYPQMLEIISWAFDEMKI